MKSLTDFISPMGLFMIALVLLLSGCSGGSKSAIWNGLYLDYQVGTSGSCRISFEEAASYHFKVLLSADDCSLRPEGYQEGEDLIVDKFLQPVKDGQLIWGEAVFLWLPDDKRKVGSHWTVGGHFEVKETKQWREWEVAMVTAKIGILEGNWYYHLESGFLVGMEKIFADERNLIYLLKETNAEGV